MRFTLRRLDRPTLAALTASRMRRPPRPRHRRSRVWPEAPTQPGPSRVPGPDYPCPDPSARRPIAPGRRRRVAPGFCQPAPTAAGAKVDRPAPQLRGGASLLPGTLSLHPPAAGHACAGPHHSRQPSDSAPSPAASLPASRIRPGPVLRPHLPHPGPTPFTWTSRPTWLDHPAGRPASPGRHVTMAATPPLPWAHPRRTSRRAAPSSCSSTGP